ncbi:hypothetical protein HIMB11_01979 [Rhodobacteraceae bacterium HIMB11]|nr:hypothetical protein HIMB11_01979 [Rhodobacteraceae bacterium HIMB11]
MTFNWPWLASVQNMNKFLILVSAFGILIMLSYVIGLAVTIDLLQDPENLTGKILISVTLFH